MLLLFLRNEMGRISAGFAKHRIKFLSDSSANATAWKKTLLKSSLNMWKWTADRCSRWNRRNTSTTSAKIMYMCSLLSDCPWESCLICDSDRKKWYIVWFHLHGGLWLEIMKLVEKLNETFFFFKQMLNQFLKYTVIKVSWIQFYLCSTKSQKRSPKGALYLQ